MMFEGASIAMLNAQNEVLLFLRDDVPHIRFPNLWDLPGGIVEPGETPEQTVRREMLEEIELELKNPVLFKRYILPDRIENMFWERIEIDISTTRLHEGQELKWFSENQIKSMREDALAFGFQKLLMEFFRVRPFAS
jgi:8-oxo-dGTP diphosphatase